MLAPCHTGPGVGTWGGGAWSPEVPGTVSSSPFPSSRQPEPPRPTSDAKEGALRTLVLEAQKSRMSYDTLCRHAEFGTALSGQPGFLERALSPRLQALHGPAPHSTLIALGTRAVSTLGKGQ